MPDSIANPVWAEHARQWARLGPPLRPSAEEATLVANVACRWHETNGRPPRVLLLGVTPELATLPWPEGTSLVAVDRSEAMIAAVWPKPPGAEVVCADWLALPTPDASVDLVVGDGAINVLPSLDLYAPFARELRRVLREDGLLHLRTFVVPDGDDALYAIALDVREGRIRNFHALKWRVVMALGGGTTEGVVLDDVWQTFRRLWPDENALAGRLGCDGDTVATIHSYRGATARYTHPTLARLRAVFAQDFTERSSFTPSYELGERCVSMLFEARVS